MNKKMNIGLLMLVFTIGIAVITGVSIAGFRADQEMSSFQPTQIVATLGNRGTVAGVAVEKATVTIDRGTGTTLNAAVSITDDTNVLEALTQATNTYSLKLETKTYGEMGTLVNTIGDLSGGQDGKYWSYYVNGQYASVAADKQLVKSGDKIEFRFEKSNF